MRKHLGSCLLSGMMVLFLWGCHEEVGPLQNLESAGTELATSEFLMPEGALVFADGKDLGEALESIKAGTFEVGKYTQGEKPFCSLYSQFEEAQAASDAILDPLLALQEEEWEAHEAQFEAAKQALTELEQKYQGVVLFENNYPKDLVYEDNLMAQLMTVDGLLVIGTQLFRYTNEGMHHVQLSPERNVVADIMAPESNKGVSTLAYNKRTPVMAEDGCNTAELKRGGSVEVRVRNTYIPRTEQRQVWIPENCDSDGIGFECPPGDDCDIPCRPGYWTTRTVVVGETLTNTRVRAIIETYKVECWGKKPFEICFQKKHKMDHILIITGMGLNSDVSGNRKVTDVEYDVPTNWISNSLNVQGGVSEINLFCDMNLFWIN